MTRADQLGGWASAVALLVATACSPSDPLLVPCPVLTGAGGAGSGGAGGSGLNGPDTLVVDVVTTGLDDFVDQQPAAGAVVALDLPGGDGRRIEQTVGADGRVAFAGLDWTLPGSAAVTAYLPGYLPQTFAGLTGDSAAVLAELDGTDVLTVPLRPVDPEMVILSGLATSMLDPSNK